MKLVIDTNRIMAGLIRNGTSRTLIFSKDFQFFTPDQAMLEIAKYKEELCMKANLTNDSFELLLSILFEKITIIPKEEYSEYLEESKSMLNHKEDAPFLALAFALNTEGIWTDDKGFKDQNKMKILTTKDMVELTS